jgi:hypothetical protein
MTGRKTPVPHDSVIARNDQQEGRGNPSCLEGRVQRVRVAYRFTVDRHARKGLAMRTRSVNWEEQRDAAIHRVSKDAYGEIG